LTRAARPMGWHFHWVLAVVVAFGFRFPAFGFWGSAGSTKWNGHYARFVSVWRCCRNAGDYVDLNWMFDPHDSGIHLLASATARRCTYVDAVAARETIEPEKFRDGISKIIDGTVECLNASTETKGSPLAPAVSALR
jgi:hypothetical protein